ncbi:MAG: MotA/TolQ/ExbB proton channel family protein [Gemmatimonadota bacterium]|nr:MotA/TolQ/ExbB proton channel family protein [Gemmatimonadota bacterium]MDE2783860.1 MotA/TolQ/ExbB proton channel family protein [Gemmatimonadota bacterium]MDE2865489.1 MotA/TolQ/ExbB proton channel family protein [Gemmatimonadota bacterium]MXV95778.1 MotA/TolQ/ExbB proton channel family protein [Gemmatimonadota bacterium]MXX57226.1 MotA/TolQ/ExbB proton channel family protein [Gemmatimonadota bacterium]
MASLMNVFDVLLQLPGMEAPDLTFTEQMAQSWEDAGFMRWPLGLCLLVGILVIIWKFFDIFRKSASTRRILREVDELLSAQQIKEALEVTRESNSPAANILHAGLERQEEGTDRVMKAIENQGLIELSKLESGLVVLATLTNVAPLLGFLGTVMGMIAAFQAIELAGEVDATTVASGIKIALTTTAAGLAIAIPVSIAHNYFVSRIDHLVIDMEESAQKMIDALFSMQAGQAAGGD